MPSSRSEALSAQLAPIRARADAATPGPWETLDTYFLSSPTQIDGYANQSGRAIEQARIDRDREFMAAARTDVPALLAIIDRLTDALDIAETAIKGAQEALWIGSVPLGQSVIRHWDAKILAARNVLADYDAAKEAMGHE